MPGVVVDQHFLRRNRFGRLRSVLDKNTGLIGLGVDEQTAMVYSIATDRLEVLGDSYVVACVPRESKTRHRVPAGRRRVVFVRVTTRRNSDRQYGGTSSL